MCVCVCVCKHDMQTPDGTETFRHTKVHRRDHTHTQAHTSLLPLLRSCVININTLLFEVKEFGFKLYLSCDPSQHPPPPSSSAPLPPLPLAPTRFVRSCHRPSCDQTAIYQTHTHSLPLQIRVQTHIHTHISHPYSFHVHILWHGAFSFHQG